MFDLAGILDIPPYSLPREDKAPLMMRGLIDLCGLHQERCPEYRRLLARLGHSLDAIREIHELPFFPVRLFKDFELLSIDRSEIVKTLTSSGTTGSKVSRIYLDRGNAANQTKVLSKIVSSFIGPKRLPMLIIDSGAVVTDRARFSARGAGILGFSLFGHDLTYALDEQMKPARDRVQAFLERHAAEDVLIFGFTSMVWDFFRAASGEWPTPLPLKNAILIHGGGWKRMTDQAVDNATFRRFLSESAGIGRIANYYGMVEQTGSIFMECEEGNLHSSIFSDIIIRDPRDFCGLPAHRRGIVQLVSLLPTSYPGHSILTEDEGEVLGEDDCGCGRMGRFFRIHGRLSRSEIRGCSDVPSSRS